MDYRDSPNLIEVFDFDILHMELNTPLYIFVLVLVVMFCLNKLLFQPVLRTLDNRAKLRASLDETAQARRAQIDKLAADYEAQLAKVREQVAQARGEGARETQAEVDAILAATREETRAELATALEELRAQVGAAKQDLDAAAQRLADQTTQRILQA